jgi:hypothetical protein
MENLQKSKCVVRTIPSAIIHIFFALASFYAFWAYKLLLSEDFSLVDILSLYIIAQLGIFELVGMLVGYVVVFVIESKVKEYPNWPFARLVFKKVQL